MNNFLNYIGVYKDTPFIASTINKIILIQMSI